MWVCLFAGLFYVCICGCGYDYFGVFVFGGAGPSRRHAACFCRAGQADDFVGLSSVGDGGYFMECRGVGMTLTLSLWRSCWLFLLVARVFFLSLPPPTQDAVLRQHWDTWVKEDVGKHNMHQNKQVG